MFCFYSIVISKLRDNEFPPSTDYCDSISNTVATSCFAISFIYIWRYLFLVHYLFWLLHWKGLYFPFLNVGSSSFHLLCSAADSQGLLCTHSTKIYILSSVSVLYTHCSGWGLRPTNPRVATVAQKVLKKILFFCVFAIMCRCMSVSVLPI